MLYIGLPRYTKDEMEQLLGSRPGGIVLGDLFCGKKMFPHGGAELPELLFSLKEKGISAIYQTPMYATDRIFSTVVQTVGYYYDRELIDAVIAQDIGIVSALHRKHGSIPVIWGRMGYARTPVINTDTVAFYMEKGVSGFECKNPEQADYAQKVGASAYLMIGYPEYLTVNRECYYRFEHNIFDGNCGTGCLCREKIVFPAGQGIESTLDGYVIGWRNVYLPECIERAAEYDHCIIYADSASEAMEKMKGYSNQDK